MTKYAREAGESCEDIKAEVSEALALSGCPPSDCDCEFMRQVMGAVGVALAALAIVATRGKSANKLAAEETAALIERLRRTSGLPVGTVEVLESVKSLLYLNTAEDEDLEEQFQWMLDSLQEAAKVTTYVEPPPVDIIEP